MGDIVNSGVEGRMTRTKEYSSLNGMKAFAAIGIMLMHIRANGNYDIDGYLYNTVILSLTDFVFLFMVISAFGLCCGYFEKMVSKNVDIFGFYSRRFQKIFFCISPRVFRAPRDRRRCSVSSLFREAPALFCSRHSPSLC